VRVSANRNLCTAYHHSQFERAPGLLCEAPYRVIGARFGIDMRLPTYFDQVSLRSDDGRKTRLSEGAVV
jgi:hypothetical protein